MNIMFFMCLIFFLNIVIFIFWKNKTNVFGGNTKIRKNENMSNAFVEHIKISKTNVYGKNYKNTNNEKLR